MSAATKAVYDRLVELVGANVADIHAVSLPPDAVFPCVVYSQIFGGDGRLVSGTAGDTYRYRFQIDIYHSVFSGLLALRQTVVTGFHRWSVSGSVHDTRIDMDLPYTMDELDTSLPNVFRHIIDIGIEIPYSAV